MEVVTSLFQGRTAAAQCGLFTYKSVPVIFEPPCNSPESEYDYQMIRRKSYLGKGRKAAFVRCTPPILPRDSNFVRHAVAAPCFFTFPSDKEKEA